MDDAAVLHPVGHRGVSCPRPPGLAAIPRSRASSDWSCRWCSGSSCSSRPGRSIWSGSATASTPAPSGVGTRITSKAGSASAATSPGWASTCGTWKFLFVFSVLALPLFLVLRSRAGDRLVAALSRPMTVPGLIFLLAIPIAIMEFIANSPALQGSLLGQRGFGGWSLLPYLAIFIIGFLLAGSEEMARAMERHRFAGLIVGPPDVRGGLDRRSRSTACRKAASALPPFAACSAGRF